MRQSAVGDRPVDPIRQPIINSPYDYPLWHYDIGEGGVARGPAKRGRRPSEDYVAPVPGSTGQAKALFGSEDPRASMEHVAKLRYLVNEWRVDGYPGATNVSRELLFYWEDPDRERRLYFAQLDAVRTLIYLSEVAPYVSGSAGDILKSLNAVNSEYNDGMSRVAVKMATGVGKTVVMAMTALWQSANFWDNPADERFTNRFVAIAPGITVRDRLLSGLRADSVDQADVYSEMDLLPLVGEYRKRINSAQIEVVNFQQFMQKKIDAGASGNGKIVSGYQDKYETEVEALSRVLGDLFALGHERVLALNDEGHHCHRDGGKSAEGRESAVWYGGLKSLHDRGRLHSVVDFSATPMFISGDRSRKNRLFPWVVSDYPIVDAIEAGIVKIPSAPVSDNLSQQDAMPLFRDIYNLTKGGKSGFMSASRGRSNWINEDLAAALRTMYDDYAAESRRWRRVRTDSKVPTVVIVANSVANADGLFKYIAGYENDDGALVDGRVGGLLSNIENGAYADAPRTIFMHSKMEASEVDQAGGVSKPIRRLADIYREKYPHARLSEDRRDHRKLAEGSHYEVMRRVLNTVGKPGEPGERVRCVVSVGMITEGWDAGTVTHMIGFRAFGSQLLCEQVGGRTLLRRVYEVGKDGKFAPEYSTIFGVPWDYVRSTENGERGDAPDPSLVHAVRLVPGRERHRVCWPNVVGYDEYGGKDEISIGVEDWDSVERLSLSSDDVRRTTLASIPGRSVDASADLVSFRRLAFHAVGDFVGRQKARHAASSAVVDNAGLFRRALNVVERGRELGVIEADAGRLYDLTIGTDRYLSAWLDRVSAVGESVSRRDIEAKLDDDGAPLKFYTPFSEYQTGRELVYETLKSEISHAVCDSSWELRAAETLDLRDDVVGWVRNERLNWHIPWLDESGATAIWRRYMPDFVARVVCEGAERELILVIEIKGQEREGASAKRRYAEEFWIPSVNNHPEFSGLGHWDYLYVTHPDALDGMINEAKSEFLSSL